MKEKQKKKKRVFKKKTQKQKKKKKQKEIMKEGKKSVTHIFTHSKPVSHIRNDAYIRTLINPPLLYIRTHART